MGILPSMFTSAWVDSHYKWIQSFTDGSPLSYDETFRSWWARSLPGWLRRHSQGAVTKWIVWWVWQLCKSRVMALTITRSQPSWTPMGHFVVMCYTSLAATIIKTSKGVNIFGKNGVHCSSTVPETSNLFPCTYCIWRIRISVKCCVGLFWNDIQNDKDSNVAQIEMCAPSQWWLYCNLIGTWAEVLAKYLVGPYLTNAHRHIPSLLLLLACKAP